MAPKKRGYSRKHRLTRERELRRVKEEGKRLRTEDLDARVILSSLSYCRVAVIVGKHDHTIVERNRLRRRIRELIRTRLIPLYKGLDLIMRVLPSAYAADFRQLGNQVDQISAELLVIAPRN